MDHDSWQEAILSQRHVHNRKTTNPSRATAFHPRKCFGSYSLSCPAAARSVSENVTGQDIKQAKRKGRRQDQGSLEVWRLTDSGDGMLGVMTLRGVMDVSVVLAGSRSVMERIVASLSKRDGLPSNSEEEGNAQPSEQEGSEGDTGSEDESDALSSEASEEENAAAPFEKNSFRVPKFWLRFQQIAAAEVIPGDDAEERTGGWGYIVFSGGECKKFQGTLTCESLGWDNVPITGWKQVGMSERDHPFILSQA